MLCEKREQSINKNVCSHLVRHAINLKAYMEEDSLLFSVAYSDVSSSPTSSNIRQTHTIRITHKNIEGRGDDQEYNASCSKWFPIRGRFNLEIKINNDSIKVRKSHLILSLARFIRYTLNSSCLTCCCVIDLP